MAFDVSKFLALTALIAGTGYACSSTPDTNEPGGGAGTSGSAGENSGGSSSNQGGAADAGNGGAVVSSAGEGGVPAAAGAGAGAGGQSLGGAASGGAGGAPDMAECLGSLAEGGAGGEPGVEPSLEDLCGAFFDTCPGAENLPPSYAVCEGVRQRATPGVAVAVAECITALSTDDQCDEVKVSACVTDLEGRGCANPGGEVACASITSNCNLVDVATCRKILDLVSVDSTEAVTGCMDPADEGWYKPAFGGSCAERLDDCIGIELL